MSESKVMCKRCILHSKVPGVQINEEGYCSFCGEDHDAQETTQNAGAEDQKSSEYMKKMEELFENIKKQNRMYDALVLFSGGKDSTYLMHLAKHKYNLRVLGFAMLYPIAQERASKNIDDVSKVLGVDIIKFIPDESMYRKYMKYGLLEGHKYGMDEKSGCYNCSFLFKWAAMKLAIKLGIPVILIGMDKAQAGGPYFVEGESFKNVIKEGKKPFGVQHDIFADALGEEYKGSLYDFNAEELLEAEFPTYIGPFSFMEYDYISAVGELETLGLKSENFKTLLTNCDAAYLFDYITYAKYDCPSYVKAYATGLRKQIPTISQLSSNPEESNLIPREKMLTMLEDYKKVLNYVVENNLQPGNMTPEQKEKLEELAVTSYQFYGKETADFLIERILKVNDFANYFEIDMKNIEAVEAADAV